MYDLPATNFHRPRNSATEFDLISPIRSLLKQTYSGKYRQ